MSCNFLLAAGTSRQQPFSLLALAFCPLPKPSQSCQKDRDKKQTSTVAPHVAEPSAVLDQQQTPLLPTSPARFLVRGTSLFDNPSISRP